MIALPPLKYDEEARRLSGFGGRLVLSASEHIIFMRLWSRRGQLVSQEQIISALWPNPDDEPREPEADVQVYVARLRRKLWEAGGEPEKIIQTVWGAGYLMPR